MQKVIELAWTPGVQAPGSKQFSFPENENERICGDIVFAAALWGKKCPEELEQDSLYNRSYYGPFQAFYFLLWVDQGLRLYKNCPEK